MCDRAENSFREQFFGRQLKSSGSMDFYDRTAGDFGAFAVHFPTNPEVFTPELGFMGARYLDSYAPIMPEYFRPGYQGVLPLKEQPTLEMPRPYREPVLF